MARVALTAGLAGALAVAAAGPAPAQAPVVAVKFTGGTIYHREVIPPGKGHVFRVTCPPGWRPISGSPVGFDPQAPMKASVVSAPSNSWLFRYDNLGTAPTTITVMVLCSKPRPFGVVPPGVKLPLKLKLKVKSVAVAVPPVTVKSVKLVCPPGTLPVGAGQSQTETTGRARATQSPGNFPGRISRWEIDGRTKITTFDNDGSGPLRFFGELLCGDVVDRTGKDVRALVKIRMRQTHQHLHAGLNTFRSACPRGMFPWWVGWQFPAGHDALAAAYGIEIEGMPHWAFFAGGDEPLDLYAECTRGTLRVLEAPR